MMEKSIKITFIIVGSVLAIFLMSLFVFYDVSGSTITSNGNAELEVTPDLVSIYLRVETIADNAEESKNINSQIYDEFLVNYIVEGFDKNSLKDLGYNVNPNYNWENGREITGYTALRSMKVELKKEEFEEVSNLIDLAVDSGVLVNYINFELSIEKQNEYKAEVLKLATQDAKVKAESIAEGLEKDIGKLVSVSSSNFGYSPWYRYGEVSTSNLEMAKSDIAEINPDEETIRANVAVVYRIK